MRKHEPPPSVPRLRPPPVARALKVLDDSERFQVEECRRVLAGIAAGSLAIPETYGNERALRDVGRTLLDLLDKIAPKEADDA